MASGGAGAAADNAGVGFLSSASNAPPGLEQTPKGFRAGLNEAGYFVGRNVTIEVFLANGRYDRLPALADEMVRRQVNLIVASADQHRTTGCHPQNQL